MLYWLSSSERNAKAAAEAEQICAGCVRAAEELRLGDIVKYVEQPCVACLDAVEKHSWTPINKLTTVGALPSQDVSEDGTVLYNCYHRFDPSQKYQSPQSLDCHTLFGGAGIHPAEARELGERMRKDREIIRIKGNRSPMNGILAGI